MTELRLAFTEPVGPRHAPLVVLGPSLGTSTILWDKVVPVLASRYRVTAWDLPGHGVSEPASAHFAVADLADAVAATIEGSFLYAGVSLGGATGLELALRHRQLVRGAAIVASGAKLGDSQGWADRAAQVRAQSTASVIVASAGRWFAPGSIEREPELSGRLLHALRDADDESYSLCCEALAEYDVRDRLQAITVPVLALWGQHDQVAPQAKADEIAAGVPTGTSAEIAEAAHLPPAEQPEATGDALMRFFDTIQMEGS